MRLYSFVVEGRPRLGGEQAGRLVDLERAYTACRAEVANALDALPFLADMLAFIQGGSASLAAAEAGLAFARGHMELTCSFGDVRLLAPLARPGKILCSGVNYREHQQENPAAVLPETPGFFAKLPSAIIGPGDAIVHPRMVQQLDYEVELAVVIGRRLRHVSENEAMAGVFGYTILHDVSARDIQFKAPQSNQITLGKNFDTFAPLGPCIVTPDDLPDPATLRLRTLVNNQLMQDGSNTDWLFPLPHLLSFLSQVMTLEPGDIVTTGTPAGVGVFRQPPVFLKPGDEVTLEIEGIGRLQNHVMGEAVG